jgi:hypothetical protein
MSHDPETAARIITAAIDQHTAAVTTCLREILAQLQQITIKLNDISDQIYRQG